MSGVILPGAAAAGQRQASGPGSARQVVPVLVAFGLTMAMVGLIDLAMAWWPPHFGKGEWEFGTASRTFNSLALGTTGFIALVSAGVLGGWTRGLRALAVVSLFGTLFLLAAFVLFGLNVPLALSAVPATARAGLVRAIVRTTLFAVLYLLFYGWLSWYTWRRGGAAKGAV